jgi:hypothetical protein
MGERNPLQNVSQYEPMFNPDSPWEDYDVATRINLLRAFCEAKVTPAIHDALSLVLDSRRAVPKWLARLLLEIVAQKLELGGPDLNGEISNERDDYLSRMLHFYRWRHVKKLRSRGVKYDDCFGRAAEDLDGTDIGCGEDMMETSYKIVSRALKTPSEALRYYTARKSTRLLTGTYIPKAPQKQAPK